MVRAGTLDRSDELNVVAHIWTKRKMGGIVTPDDVPTWPGGAPPVIQVDMEAFLAEAVQFIAEHPVL